MIRALRRKFVLGAMLALSILLCLLLSGILLVGYVRMEIRSDELLDHLLNEAESPSMPDRPPALAFGYAIPELAQSAGHYLLITDAAGELLRSDARGIWGADETALQEIAREILRGGETRGKIQAYKFGYQASTNESFRIILLDNSMQVRMLTDTLRTGLLLSFLGLFAMFLILLPVSRHVVRSYALNIEKQKQFITNAGHEIKTPLAILQSNIDAMELIQGENKWSRNIRGQVERLHILLQQLLFLARMDENGLARPQENVNLSDLLREETASYAEILRKRRLSFQPHIQEGVVLRANRETLKQLIHILMDNAAQYASADGLVSLRLEKRPRKARITIANPVERFPDCPPETLFDRFYRGDSARTQKKSGCGVGLSAAQSIAELHRGKIFAQYEAGNIIRFIVDLPA